MSNFMDGIKSTLNNECNVSVTEITLNHRTIARNFFMTHTTLLID